MPRLRRGRMNEIEPPSHPFDVREEPVNCFNDWECYPCAPTRVSCYFQDVLNFRATWAGEWRWLPFYISVSYHMPCIISVRFPPLISVWFQGTYLLIRTSVVWIFTRFRLDFVLFDKITFHSTWFDLERLYLSYSYIHSLLLFSYIVWLPGIANKYNNFLNLPDRNSGNMQVQQLFQGKNQYSC